MDLSSYKRNTPAKANPDKEDSARKAKPAKSAVPTRPFKRPEKKGSQNVHTEALSKTESKESQNSNTKLPLRSSTEKERSQGSSTELPLPSSTEKEPGRSSSTEPGRSEGIRLNRYIAHCGVCSRREADELIADGKIRVNKKLVTEMGYKVMPGDSVFMGKKLLKKEDYAYVLLNKPKNFITTTKDTHDRKTVMDLVAKASEARLYPVGRLDRNTTGLLLLTNDGELTDRLSHPSNNIKKIYQVEINKSLEREHFEEIVKGFTLDDGPIAIDDIAILTADSMSIGIEIHSGRNRIVRRIFEHFDYEVTKLDRVVYAGLTKVNLPRGKWRHLNDKEIGLLKKKGRKR